MHEAVPHVVLDGLDTLGADTVDDRVIAGLKDRHAVAEVRSHVARGANDARLHQHAAGVHRLAADRHRHAVVPAAGPDVDVILGRQRVPPVRIVEQRDVSFGIDMRRDVVRVAVSVLRKPIGLRERTFQIRHAPIRRPLPDMAQGAGHKVVTALRGDGNSTHISNEDAPCRTRSSRKAPKSSYAMRVPPGSSNHLSTMGLSPSGVV